MLVVTVTHNPGKIRQHGGEGRLLTFKAFAELIQSEDQMYEVLSSVPVHMQGINGELITCAQYILDEVEDDDDDDCIPKEPGSGSD